MNSIFGQDEESVAILKKNIESIVATISKQFREPEDSYRELIQNSIDAESPQINVYSETRDEADDETVTLDVIVEDFGCGMSVSERDDFFLKLFRSSKEDDDEKIGKYGIGISSVFALGIDELTVETKKEDHKGWSLHIKDIKDRPSYRYSDNDRKVDGTKIVISRRVPKEEVEAHNEKLKEKVQYYCDRAKIPIYVHGEHINLPFNLDTALQVTRSEGGIEFVLGVADGSYSLFNNRLKLFEGKEIDDKYSKKISALISSPHLRHTFSRDEVVADHAYGRIIKKVLSHYDELFVTCLDFMSEMYTDPKISSPPKFPEFSLEQKFGFERSIISPQQLDAIASNARRQIKGTGTYWDFKRTPEEVMRIIEEHTPEVEKYKLAKKEYDASNDQRKRDFRNALQFVQDYLRSESEIARDIAKGGNGFERFVRKIRKKVSPFAILSTRLPHEIYDIPIIPTINNGLIPLGDVLDELAQHNNLAVAQRITAQKIIEKGSTVRNNIFYDTIVEGKNSLYRVDVGGHTDRSGNARKIMQAILPLENRSDYTQRIAESCLLELALEEEELNDQERAFAQDTLMHLPAKLKKNVGGVRFYNMQGEHSGSISMERPVVKTVRKKDWFYNTTVERPVYGRQAYLMLNRDDTLVQELVSLHSSGTENERTFALSVVGDLAKQRHFAYGGWR